eukprot:TRINITY_DN21986_c0_g1_i1.p1 TRINITY_DN21986_c0_g1~~TRINITY_DN21986_c0_g1_i1.p1  ORF type:complete len:262 (+),score=27.28 TRINITY_DN21986_c0_g1_i1:400-1185(+)
MTHKIPETDADKHVEERSNITTFSEMMATCRNPTIICLGPLTDLAIFFDDAAISRTHRIKAVLIQGQNIGAEPDPASYNLRCDIIAAGIVFNKCVKRSIPMVLLGKHAAYQAPLGLQHITEIDKSSEALSPWSLRQLVLTTLVEFVREESDMATQTLRNAYKVDRKNLLRGDPSTPVLETRILEEFPYLTVPYDPLCCMALGHIYPSLSRFSVFLTPEPQPSSQPASILCIGTRSSSPPIHGEAALQSLIDTCQISLHRFP